MSLPLKTASRLARARRMMLAGIVCAVLLLVSVPMARSLGWGGWTILKASFFALFLILFAQVIFSSAVAVAGWWSLARRPDPAQLTAPALEEIGGKLPATAIVMPVFNEDASRVFQGLLTMYRSLQETGHAESFDVFILSDSNDSNCWITEEKAWFELCRQVQGFGRIFYRKRRVQLHHKSGNIADFCRRWGANYRYMIVLDADSVMTGSSIVRLTALMEQRPWTGIIQTTTMPILGRSLFQRIEQFAAFAYRPIFAAGASFWQLCDSTFFGHNAIIRLQPFMRHCAMPELPEIGPLGKHVLSHDTIEAALIRRGGFEVWQIPALGGTYEEGPPHLVASLKRDRRWCHGNLQHLWFLLERGIKGVSRFNIFNGIFAYASSPLWLASLILGVAVAVQQRGLPHGTHSGPMVTSGILYAFIMVLLLLPKALGAALILRSPENQGSDSPGRVIGSVILETLYSMVPAPILMLFYTRFVFSSLFGFKVGWGPQTRSDEQGPGWMTWVRVHAVNFLLAAGALAWMSARIPTLIPWMIPVLLGPLIAIPFSRWSASCKLGHRARAAGWFVTPEEVAPPPELQKIEEPFLPPAQPFFQGQQYAADYGLLQAALDPYINSVHVSLLRQRSEPSPRTQEYMAFLADKLLTYGPAALSPAEKRTLLWDADSMFALHQKLWGSPSADLHEWWQDAFRNYVEATTISTRRNLAV